MNSETPTILKNLRHQSCMTLTDLYNALRKRKLKVSYPTLLKIDNGYRSIVKRDQFHKIISRHRKKYTPEEQALKAIAKIFKVHASKIYQDRSNGFWKR